MKNYFTCFIFSALICPSAWAEHLGWFGAGGDTLVRVLDCELIVNEGVSEEGLATGKVYSALITKISCNVIQRNSENILICKSLDNSDVVTVSDYSKISGNPTYMIDDSFPENSSRSDFEYSMTSKNKLKIQNLKNRIEVISRECQNKK